MVSLAVISDSPCSARVIPMTRCRSCGFSHINCHLDDGILERQDRKPKRLASRKLGMLQGLSGVGPALAHRLLLEFGSVERVITADEASLVKVRGVGSKTAARIRELVC